MRSDAIADRLAYWCQVDPGAPAIGAVGAQLLSRADLDEVINRGREALREAGVGSADRVAVLVPEGLEGALVTIQIAASCTIAPLRPSLGAAGWSPVLAALSPDALVVSADWPEAADAARGLGIAVLSPELAAGPGPRSAPRTKGPADAAPDDPELLMATSGSTGPPKWVRIPKSRVAVGSHAMSRIMDLTPDDRALLALPFHHALGMVSGLLLPLLSGGSVVVAPGFDAVAFLRALSDHDITWFSIPPAMLRGLMEQQALTPLPAGCHRLRLIRTGTVTLPRAVIDALAADFGVPVIEAYGMTECPHITCNPPDAPRYGSVGRPVVEELMVIDNANRPVPTGEWGQVVIKGAPLMSGYLSAGEVGAAMRDGWLYTGDEGRLDAEGYLYLRGRFGERINRGGAMVMPAEVDAALLTHNDVRQAAAFAVAHPSLSQDLAAAVVLKPGSATDEAGLRAYLSRRLEPRQVPNRIVVVDEIPVGGAGKIVRDSLADALGHLLHVDYEPAWDSVEESVIELFDNVLSERLQPGRKVGRLTNFFLAGGDSLAAIRLMAGLARAGWGEHSPSLLFEHLTPAGVAAALRGMPQRPSGNIITLQPEGDQAPLFIIHGLGGQLFNYQDLPRAFAPNRPVFGVQAIAESAESLSGTTVTDLADRYAAQIMAHQPSGPIHLLGYSLGGWYAHAVADVLVRRGAELGMLAILDSPLMTRVRLSSQLRLAGPRLAVHLGRLWRPPNGVERGEYLKSSLLQRLRRIGLRVLYRRDPGRAVEQAAPVRLAGALDPFKVLLWGYRPPKVPVGADLFAPPSELPWLRHVWRVHTSGVRCHPLFDRHRDFFNARLASTLAAELMRTLKNAESP